MANMAIIVEFETMPGKEDAFLASIKQHARATLAEEPGCLRFEVLRPVERDGTPVPLKFIVNELYADRDAVAAHEANPRLPSVRERNRHLLASSRLILSAVLD